MIVHSVRADATGRRDMLELTAVGRSFGGAHAVRNVTLNVPPTGITGLIGPNGAGKTTLFNLIAGVIRPSTGTIRFEGRDITREGAHTRLARGIGRTFQIARPFPAMTVLENLMVAAPAQTGESFAASLLRPARVRQEELHLRDQAMAMLDFLTLAPLARQAARVLSGGQRKLLELGRVLMAAPRLVLLDEPAAGVAPALLTTITDRIATLAAGGLGFLLVEHDMHVVRRLCGHVHVMADGVLLTSGPPEDVLTDPRVTEAYLGAPLAA